MSLVRISVPGQPIVRIIDSDPELALTPRQREYVIALRSVNWNRCRAGRQLGVGQRAVQDTIATIRALGYPIPPGATRGPDLTQRTRRWKVKP